MKLEIVTSNHQHHLVVSGRRACGRRFARESSSGFR